MAAPWEHRSVGGGGSNSSHHPWGRILPEKQADKKSFEDMRLLF